MIEILTADTCIDASTVAASPVAEAMSKSEKPRHKVVGAGSQDSMAHDHKDSAQTAKPDLPKLVSMDDVRTDGGTQARVAINETVVKDYADALKEGAKLPPVVLYYDESADVYWLADGFHRFDAHRAIGRVAISAFVKDGTLRDAKLHAAGANGTHGLPRTNADKRCAVLLLLEDPERTTWSDNAIAKACCVSHTFVGNVRASLESVASETPTERTYTTKHGSTATMQTAKVGKSKPAASPAVTPQASVDDAFVAEGCAAFDVPSVETVPLTEEDVLRTKVATLHEQIADLQADLAEALVDNEHMARVFDADDQLKAALAEVARFKALAENAERTLAARSHEFNERARNVIYWKNRAEKAEKQPAKTEAIGESSALRAENAALRAQLGELAEQFEETLAEAETMRKVVEADVPLAEAVQQLKQAQELNRVLETRLHGLVNEKNEILRRYNGARHELDKVKRAHGKLSVELDTLHAENGHLRTQLGDLAAQFGEAMACYDEMRAILEASVPLDEAPRQLQQALELARTLESRVAEAPRSHADAQREQADVTQPIAHETRLPDEGFVELVKTEPFEATLPQDDHMAVR